MSNVLLGLRGSFKFPSNAAIGGELMGAEYGKIMNGVMLEPGKLLLICFMLDGDTNVKGEQVINMMACGPKPLFLEHFTMELRR